MADSSFGLKIGLEGEREFKRAITDINREMRVLGSEMKLVASQFDKNDKSASALTARIKCWLKRSMLKSLRSTPYEQPWIILLPPLVKPIRVRRTGRSSSTTPEPNRTSSKANSKPTTTRWESLVMRLTVPVTMRKTPRKTHPA